MIPRGPYNLSVIAVAFGFTAIGLRVNRPVDLAVGAISLTLGCLLWCIVNTVWPLPDELEKTSDDRG